MKVGFFRCCYGAMLILLWIAAVGAEELPIPEGMAITPEGNVEWYGKNINVSPFYMDRYETTQQTYEKIRGRIHHSLKGQPSLSRR